jgi:DNA adenine methylase
VAVLRAPFPYFGGKRSVIDLVWSRLGRPKQYIEPFCGSAAILLGATEPASLEVVNDLNGFIANFWRATKHQPADVARWTDYPVSHIDLGARHRWLMEQRDRIGVEMHDPDWPGDAKVAGWWLWGQCSWIGSGWADWHGQIPHAGNAGRGELLTSAGVTAWEWLHKLAHRLERVRITHGDWDRCLNNHYGGYNTAVFLDPPYKAYESLYGAKSDGVACAVESWARDNANLRIALCGHVGDYDLPGWDVEQWDRGRLTYGGGKTTSLEAIWFSPACIKPAKTGNLDLFGGGGT